MLERIDFDELASRWLRQLSVVSVEIQEVKLACSGHVDSIVLFELLRRFSQLKKILFTQVIHVNYRRRGQDSDIDQELIETLCKTAKIDFQCLVLDPDAFDKAGGGNFQDWARVQRYRFFKRYKEKETCLIALAHHGNDLAENVLMRIARGTRLDNLLGMETIHDGFWRPLLPYSKAAIEAFAQENNLTYGYDITNSSSAYARNLVRLEVIPKLESLYPGATSRLISFAEDARAVSEYSEACFNVKCDRQKASFSLEEFLKMPANLGVQVLSRMIALVNGDERPSLQRTQIMEIVREIRDFTGGTTKTRRKWQVGGKFMVACDRSGVLAVWRESDLSRQNKAWPLKTHLQQLDISLVLPSKSRCQLEINGDCRLLIESENNLSPQRLRLYAPPVASEVSIAGSQKSWPVKRLLNTLEEDFDHRNHLWFVVFCDDFPVGLWANDRLWGVGKHGKLCSLQDPLVSIKLIR